MEKDILSRYDKIFDSNDDKAKEAFKSVPLDKLKKHLELVQETINNSDFTISTWSKFKFALIKDKTFYSWSGTGETFWEKFRINIKSLKLPEEFIVIHFEIENVWFQNEPLPSIWNLIEL